MQAVFDQYDLDVLAIPSEGRATTVAAITGWPIVSEFGFCSLLLYPKLKLVERSEDEEEEH